MSYLTNQLRAALFEAGQIAERAAVAAAIAAAPAVLAQPANPGNQVQPVNPAGGRAPADAAISAAVEAAIPALQAGTAALPAPDLVALRVALGAALAALGPSQAI